MKEILQARSPVFEAPPGLEQRIRRVLRENTPSRPVRRPGLWILPIWAYASLAAVMIALVSVVVISRPWKSSADLEREAIANHIRSLQATHLMDVASTDRHTVKPWFAGRIDYSPPVEDLAAAGYPLLGGRLDVLAHRPVAALVYQHRKHYINLFIWPMDGTHANAGQTVQDGYQVRSWSGAGMNYLAVSDMDSAGLDEFMKLQQAGP